MKIDSDFQNNSNITWKDETGINTLLFSINYHITRDFCG
jgi:hypothetical protein